MRKHHHHLGIEDRDGVGGILPIAIAIREKRGRKGVRGQSPLCLSLPRLLASASGKPATEDDEFHVQHCRSCRIAVIGLRLDLEAESRTETAGDMFEPAMESSVMAMPEGGIAPETRVRILAAAVRRAIHDRKSSEWSLDGAWALLEYVKKFAPEAGFLDTPARRRVAAEYAAMIEMAPDVMKVVLVYGLIRMTEARRFFIEVTREIARRSDTLAHQVTMFVLSMEAGDVKIIDSKRWNEIAGASDAQLEPHRQRVERAVTRFMTMIQPPHTLAEAAAALREDVVAMANALFAARDATAIVLNLLAMRRYLAIITSYLRGTYSDLVELFPELTATIYARRSAAGAALLLAMEATEALRAPSAYETELRRIGDSKPLITSPQERKTGT